MHKEHYLRLLIMTVLSFIAMYWFMYAMVNSFANVFSNLNQFYMAGLMAAPMLLIEPAVMGAMYPNKHWNIAIAIFGLLALAFFWFGMRRQIAISDSQFPPLDDSPSRRCHPSITHSEIKQLCQENSLAPTA